MLLVYKNNLSNSLSAKVAAFLVSDSQLSQEALLRERAEMMFKEACNGYVSVDFEMFLAFLDNAGITGEYEEEIEHLMSSFDRKRVDRAASDQAMAMFGFDCQHRGQIMAAAPSSFPSFWCVVFPFPLSSSTLPWIVLTAGDAQEMVRAIVRHSTQFSGSETWESLSSAQLEQLGRIP